MQIVASDTHMGGLCYYVQIVPVGWVAGYETASVFIVKFTVHLGGEYGYSRVFQFMLAHPFSYIPEIPTFEIEIDDKHTHGIYAQVVEYLHCRRICIKI